jgi:hypothetical protein
MFLVRSENKKEHAMKLSYIVLLADDVAETVRFWRDVMRLPITYNDESIRAIRV